MRRADLDPETVLAIVAALEALALDPDGNPILKGTYGVDRPIEIVVALDDPEFVITVIARRKQR